MLKLDLCALYSFQNRFPQKNSLPENCQAIQSALSPEVHWFVTECEHPSIHWKRYKLSNRLRFILD